MGQTIIMADQISGARGSSDTPCGQFWEGTNIYATSNVYGDSATQLGTFALALDTTYGSGLTVVIGWSAASATSGNVVFKAECASTTQNADTTDVTADSHDTENTVTDSHLGTTAKRLHEASITMTNNDSVAAGDIVTFNVGRKGADASDTLSGDVHVHYVRVTWTDA